MGHAHQAARGTSTIDASGNRQRWRALAFAILLLLSALSAGLFLYSALSVALLLGFAFVLARSSLLDLEVRRRIGDTTLELGDATDVALRITNRKPLPAPWLFWREQIDAGLDVEGPRAGFETLDAGDHRDLRYRLHTLRRGLFRVGPAVIEASGPFGLARRFQLDAAPTFVTVLPKRDPIGQGWPLGHQPVHQVPRRRSLNEDPARFLGLRAYRPGDSLRRIHWRATARTGSLQVKRFEPAVLAGTLLAIEMRRDAYPGLEGADEGGDPQLELAIHAAASVADFVLAGDQRVALLSNGTDAADRFGDSFRGGTFTRLGDALDARSSEVHTAHRCVEVPPAKGVWQNERLRHALARLETTDGADLPTFLLHELPSLPRNLVLTVVTPRLDDTLTLALGSLRRSGIEVCVVWVGGHADDVEAIGALPSSVPVYPLTDEHDLALLGARGL